MAATRNVWVLKAPPPRIKTNGTADGTLVPAGGVQAPAAPTTAAAPLVSLFCFSPAGSGACAFHGWELGLPAEIEVRRAAPPYHHIGCVPHINRTSVPHAGAAGGAAGTQQPHQGGADEQHARADTVSGGWQPIAAGRGGWCPPKTCCCQPDWNECLRPSAGPCCLRCCPSWIAAPLLSSATGGRRCYFRAPGT
jgi:hypothetical protein